MTVTQVGDLTLKVCTKCQVPKPESEFYKKSGRNCLMAVCKSCHADATKEWLRANPGKSAEYKRGWVARNPEAARSKHLRSRYGIDVDRVAEMFRQQEGRCAICKREGSLDGGREERLHVDHNHVTGELRSLLCFNCNILLGNAHEDTEILWGAILYLETWNG